MPLTAEKIVAVFPHATLTPIIGIPTYESIRELNLQLSANAAAVPSNLGCGTLGLIYLTVTPTVYATLSPDTFIPPVNPGSAPASTSSAISQTRLHTYKTNLALYEEYISTDAALKKQLLAAVDDLYVSALKQDYVGYGRVTTLDLLNHLYSAYVDIHDAALRENQERMMAPWDPSSPFETLIKQIEDAVDYADRGDNPFTPKQVVSAALHHIESTGLFEPEIKEWKAKTAEEKTWANFKKFFMKTHRYWRNSTTRTTGKMYPLANHMATSEGDTDNTLFNSEAVEALANLATATASDRATVATLTATVANLAAELAETQAKLVKALMENSKLIKQLGTKGANTLTSEGGGYDPSDAKPVHYCWTHGFKCLHPSHKCPAPKEGHVKRATRARTFGGSTLNKE